MHTYSHIHLYMYTYMYMYMYIHIPIHAQDRMAMAASLLRLVQSSYGPSRPHKHKDKPFLLESPLSWNQNVGSSYYAIR